MAKIVVYKGRDAAQEVGLEKEHYLIGRLEQADIRLDNVMVSRKHAMLVREPQGWTIQDISGKNGVFINGKQTGQGILADNDRIEIGKFLLIFQQQDQSVDEPAKKGRISGNKREDILNALAALADEDETSKAKPKPAPEPIVTKTPTPVHSAVSVDATMRLDANQLNAIRNEMSSKRQAHLKALTPLRQSVYVLQSSEITIGKSNDATIQLPSGLTVGKVHAMVKKYGDHWFIEHLSGFAGTRVNGEKISQPKRLSEGDKIQIGDHLLQLVLDMKA